MRPHPHPFERFIAKVHRRFVAMRILEQTGLGILAACAAGLPLVLIAIWRAVPPAPLVTTALALGAIAGLLTGLFRRPTLHDAATEADRQLHTADLLSSALSVTRSDDPWAGAVLASADAWSRSAAPSSVILNRLGARVWGGIGLATALLAVLALLPTYAAPTQAANRSFDHPNQSPFASTTNPRRTAPEQNPEDLRPTRDSPDDSSTRPNRPSEPTSDNQRSSNATGHDPSQGRGESHTNSKSQQPPNSSDATPSHESSAKGRSADSAGQSSQIAARANSTNSQTANPDSTSPTPPWNSPTWSHQAQQALHAVDTGQVPDSYRDVIHTYFQPR